MNKKKKLTYSVIILWFTFLTLYLIFWINQDIENSEYLESENSYTNEELGELNPKTTADENNILISSWSSDKPNGF